MKKKLNIVFTLMAVSLLGIIIFQLYWTANAYTVNKEKFDTAINATMQRALDDCKKDYFDSIRRVLVKRLSPPLTTLNIDTTLGLLGKTESQYDSYEIVFLNKIALPGEPVIVRKSQLDFYRKKINHQTALPEVLTEMSFYEPDLMKHILVYLYSLDKPQNVFSFSMADARNNPKIFSSFLFRKKPISAIVAKDKSYIKPQSSHYQKIRDSVIKILYENFTHQKKPGSILSKHYKDSIKKLTPEEQFEKGYRDAYAKRNALNGDTLLYKQVAIKAKQAYLANSNTLTNAPKNNLINLPKTNYDPLNRASNKLKPTAFAAFTPPFNYRKNDSIKFYRYFEKELKKDNIYAPFDLAITTKSTKPVKLNLHYSETKEYSYKYQGFALFTVFEPELFIKAQFQNPQYTVLKRMSFTLLLSLFLVAFTIFCFNYIFRTFIEQKKLAELKDDFINNMTHELKTPIATITVAIEGLQQFNALNDPEKTQRYLTTSRNELNRLNSLVTKVLDIATFENKQIELVKESVNINELIDEIIASEKSKTDKIVEATFTNRDNFEVILADKIHFRSVLVNLIDNAIKYSGEVVKIHINVYKNGANAVFAVKDNGIGIPQGHIGQVFDKFHRVPTGNVHSVKGTGLGLSYVKYIVEAHGGTINVKSEVNKGSEFIVSIPLGYG